jgi:hypothetical protein
MMGKADDVTVSGDGGSLDGRREAELEEEASRLLAGRE